MIAIGKKEEHSQGRTLYEEACFWQRKLGKWSREGLPGRGVSVEPKRPEEDWPQSRWAWETRVMQGGKEKVDEKKNGKEKKVRPIERITQDQQRVMHKRGLTK